MKTLRRILLILTVFSILAGLMVITVNTAGDLVGTNARNPQFRPDGGGDGFSAEGSQNRPERGERGGNGFGLMFGLTKNMFVVGALVTMIAWPKSVAKKKKRTAVVVSASGKL